jgi:hypothetical protein
VGVCAFKDSVNPKKINEKMYLIVCIDNYKFLLYNTKVMQTKGVV